MMATRLPYPGKAVDMKRLVTIILLWCGILTDVSASCLQSTVTVSCHPCTVEQALEQMEEQVDCTFSYNASQIPLDEQIAQNLPSVSLQNAIETVTGRQLNYVQRGRHLMFIEKEAAEAPKPAKKEYVIEGTVRNASTGELVSKATVYTVGDKYSALTNESGYYRLQVSGSKEFIGLSYSKKSYLDTIIVVQPKEDAIRKDIRLEPRVVAPPQMPTKEARLRTPPSEVEELPMVKLLVPDRQSQRAINLDFLEDIPVQFSLLPSIGTNRLTSGISSNTVSLNLLAGYNAGLHGFEAGGGVNIIRKDAKGLQAAGIGNIVGGQVRGLQAAGVFNNTRGSVMGLQAAGVYNLTLNTVRGVQASGVFNMLQGTIIGMQAGGLFNIATENMAGLQVAGLFNYTRKNVYFAQVAGFSNFAENVDGGQIGGFMNLADGEVRGFQAGGFMNLAEDVTGSQMAGFLNTGRDVNVQLSGFMNRSRDANVQISGFLNIARKVEGVQVGVFNVADTSALAIGVLSFSLKGYNHLDLTTDVLHPLNLSYRMGSRHFYNILHFGFGSYYDGMLLYSAGYGVGTEFKTKAERVTWNLELMARSVSEFRNNNSDLNLDCILKPLMAVRLGKKRPYLVFGPSLHIYVQNATPQNIDISEGPVTLIDNAYPPIFAPVTSRTRVTAWPGFDLGLRI